VFGPIRLIASGRAPGCYFRESPVAEAVATSWGTADRVQAASMPARLGVVEAVPVRVFPEGAPASSMSAYLAVPVRQIVASRWSSVSFIARIAPGEKESVRCPGSMM
jgi:hypothetical protein